MNTEHMNHAATGYEQVSPKSTIVEDRIEPMFDSWKQKQRAIQEIAKSDITAHDKLLLVGGLLQVPCKDYDRVVIDQLLDRMIGQLAA